MCKDNRDYLILPDGDYQSAANLELESDHISQLRTTSKTCFKEFASLMRVTAVF